MLCKGTWELLVVSTLQMRLTFCSEGEKSKSLGDILLNFSTRSVTNSVLKHPVWLTELEVLEGGLPDGTL